MGIIFDDKDLSDDWDSNDLEVGNGTINALYKFGSKDSPLKYILRGILWKNKYWNTEKLNTWLDEFRPECVFLHFQMIILFPELPYTYRKSIIYQLCLA